MKRILNYEGQWCNLSNEVAEIIHMDRISLIAGETEHYFVGQMVRLISSGALMGSPVPGYHSTLGFVTVCRLDATLAEFHGIKQSYLRLNVPQISKFGIVDEGKYFYAMHDWASFTRVTVKRFVGQKELYVWFDGAPYDYYTKMSDIPTEAIFIHAPKGL